MRKCLGCDAYSEGSPFPLFYPLTFFVFYWIIKLIKYKVEKKKKKKGNTKHIKHVNKYLYFFKKRGVCVEDMKGRLVKK